MSLIHCFAKHKIHKIIENEDDTALKMCSEFIFLPQQYFKIRSQAIEKLKRTDEPPYPHKFHVSLSLTQFIEKYKDMEPEQWADEVISLAGTVHNICIFYHE